LGAKIENVKYSLHRKKIREDLNIFSDVFKKLRGSPQTPESATDNKSLLPVVSPAINPN
jgi:hypothetical protein